MDIFYDMSKVKENKLNRGVRIPVGALRRLEPLDMPVERFLALVRFENSDTIEKVRELISSVQEL